MSVTNSWLVRGSAITLPRGLRMRVRAAATAAAPAIRRRQLLGNGAALV